MTPLDIHGLAAEHQLVLTEDEIAQLDQFLALLGEANKSMNLTRIKDREEAWRRHILDSLSLLPFIEAAGARHLLAQPAPLPDHRRGSSAHAG